MAEDRIVKFYARLDARTVSLGAGPFEQQQFGTAGVEGVKRFLTAHGMLVGFLYCSLIFVPIIILCSCF